MSNTYLNFSGNYTKVNMENKLAERIKELREEKHLSQVRLAAELDVSSGFIADIELGRKMGSIKTLMKFADFFDVSTDYLLGYRDDK